MRRHCAESGLIELRAPVGDTKQEPTSCLLQADTKGVSCLPTIIENADLNVTTHFLVK